MPQRDHDSVRLQDVQSPEDHEWQKLAQEQLPADLERQARQLKASQQAHGLPSALQLLRGLLFYMLSHSSLLHAIVHPKSFLAF